MAKSEKKEQAQRLRLAGQSIKDIAQKLSVSKGSVSLWCRQIVLTEQQISSIQKRGFKKNERGRLVGALANKQKRLNIISQLRTSGMQQVGNLSHRELILVASALYWAEGAKTSSRFVFVNSSPEMILLMFHSLVRVFGIKREDIRVGIQINHIHVHRIQDVLKFWSKLLNLPLSQFDNPYYIYASPKKVYSNMDSYQGTVRLKVKKSSVLQYKILGLIEGVVHGSKHLSE